MSNLSPWNLARPKPSYEPELGLMPVHLELNVQFDIPKKTVVGKCVIRLKALRKCSSFIELDAINFQDLKVSPQNKAHEMLWAYDGFKIQVNFVTQAFPGEERAVVVEYSVQAPPKALHFSSPSEEYPNMPHWVVSDHETERARCWFPCVDHPMVRTTADFWITADASLVALAGGELVTKTIIDESSNLAVSHWRLDTPTPSYLLCVAVGEFEQVGEPDTVMVADRTLSVAFYTTPDNVPSQTLIATFGQTKEIMGWLTKRLQTKFPLHKYFQVAAYGLGGAMENMTLVTWDDSWLIDSAAKLEKGVEVNRLVLHEMAHTYFGNIVGVRHFSHAWLKEGWAHYMECVFLQENYCENEFQYELFCSAMGYMKECEKYVRPLVTREYEHSFLMYDKHLYPGGAWRIHMLRRILGEYLFWEMTTKYLNKFWMKTVESAHFRLHCEEVGKVSLARFFDQWVESPGYPKLSGTFEYNLQKGFVNVVLTQTQVSEEHGVGLFDFGFDVVFLFANGERKVLTAEFNQQKTTSIQLFTNQQPTGILFDPSQNWLFSITTNLPEPMLLNVLQNSDDMRNKIWCGEALIHLGTPSAVKSVVKVIQKDRFFGVRLSLLTSLASHGIRYARQIAFVLRREKDKRCLQKMLMVCVIQSKQIREVLLELLADPELGPVSRRWALVALGAQKNPKDFDLLVSEAKKEGPHCITNKGAVEGLGKHSSHEAMEALMDLIQPGVCNIRLRSIGTHALAFCAMKQNKRHQRRVCNLLVELLCDNQYDVRLSAIKGLSHMGAADTIKHIENTIPTLAEQDHPQVAVMLNHLLSVGDQLGGVKILENQVAHLLKETNNLASELEALQSRFEELSEEVYHSKGEGENEKEEAEKEKDYPKKLSLSSTS